MHSMHRVCVFCGSSSGTEADYREGAFSLGKAIGERGFELVYGGGSLGLMGAVARGTLSVSAPVTGIIPEAIHKRVPALDGIRLEVVPGMHERKKRMYGLSDAFIALPGGIGTFEETFEAFTWLQLGYHRKPVALLNIRHFFDPLISLLDHATESGFIKPLHRSLLVCRETVDELLSDLGDFEPLELEKWQT
jgi:uncharacterized protein (TIGR00730 family)